MTEFPFIYVCSHAGKIGNFRWVNSDTRWSDSRSYWGRCGLESVPDENCENRPLP